MGKLFHIDSVFRYAFVVPFVAESNRIEGIDRKPSRDEVDATVSFLTRAEPGIRDVQALVFAYQPGASLREFVGVNVRVGDHIAPPGGPEIVERLADILRRIHADDPWKLHVEYETLHPFTDGNGRSGRAIWAWQMVRRQNGLPLGFLHQFYYQTLAARSEGNDG